MPTDIEILRPRALERLDRPARRRWLRMLAVFFALACLLRLPAFFVDVFNSDETFLATQAEVINHGGELYQDAADRKPPLVPYIYAASFSFFATTALWSVRIVAMAAIALTALLVAIEARRRWGWRAAWLAGLLLVFSSVAFAPQDGQAANFEVFMLPAMTAAVLLAARGRGLTSGFSVAIATLAKQTGAATLLPVLYLLWRRRSGAGVRDALAGFAVPLAVVALLVGPGDLVFWTVLGNGSYFGLGTASLYVLGLFAVMTFAFAACNLPIVWTLPRAWRERRSADLTDLWLWLLSAALSVAVGFRFFGHYYLQLLPPLCLLSAAMLVKVSRRMVQATVAVSVAVALGALAMGFFVLPFGDEPPYRSVSRYLEDQAGPNDRIFVWGHMPEIYWASGKRPATRFLSSGFLIGDWGSRPDGDVSTNVPTPGAWRLFAEDLRAHPPEFILDTTSAAVRGSEYTPMSHFPELAQLVADRYAYVSRIDGITVYERKPVAHRRAR